MRFRNFRTFVVALLLAAGCSKPPAPTQMTLVQDATDKVNFQGPAGWKEGREAKSFTWRDPSNMSMITVTSLPKGPMGLEALFKQSWNGMIALTGDAGTKPEAVKIRDLPGMQAHGEGKLEGHAITVMLTIVEASDRFVSLQGIVADRDQATRLQILKDSASSLELTP